MKQQRLTAQIALLLAFTMWGSDGLFLKVMNLPVTTIIFVDAVIAVAVLLPVLFFTGQYKSLASLKTFGILLAVGIVHTGVILTLYRSFQLTSVSNAMLAHYMGPVFVFLLAPLFLGEKRTRVFGVGLVASVCGLALMLSKGGFSLADSDVAGIAIGVVSAVFFGANIVFLKRVISSYSPLAVAFMTFVAHLVITTPFMLMDPGQISASLPYTGLFFAKVALTAVFPFLIYVSCIKALEAQRVSILGYIEPLAAAALAAVFLAEVPGWQTLVGGAMILGSGIWVIISDSRRVPVENEVAGAAV